MKSLLSILALSTLAACGGGGSSAPVATQAPTVCVKNSVQFYCDASGQTVVQEWNGLNSDHILAKRAYFDAGKGVVRAVGSADAMGQPQDFTALCEIRVGIFTAGVC